MSSRLSKRGAGLFQVTVGLVSMKVDLWSISYLSVFLYMCLCPLSTVRDYWSRGKLGQSFVQNSGMTCNEFEAITHALHFTDKTSRAQPQRDKMYKIRPLVDLCNKAWAQHFEAGQTLSLDEKRVKCKAHGANFKYNKDKPIKRGYEFVSVSCPCCGYEIRTQPCAGADEAMSRDARAAGSTEATVIDILRPFFGKNHCVWFDNLYTGVPVCARLAADKTFGGGTVRPNRKGLPDKFEVPKGASRGYVAVKTTTVSVTNERHEHKNVKLYYETFLDTRQVSFLTSICPTMTSKPGKAKTKEGVWETFDVTCTTTPRLYNAGMGGCDLGDQLGSYHLRHMQNKRPYVVLFFHLFTVSCLNGRVLWNRTHPKTEVVTVKQWYDMLCDELLAEGQVISKHAEEDSPVEVSDEETLDNDEPAMHRIEWWLKQPFSLRNDHKHVPMHLPPTKGDNRRGVCILCRQSRKGTKKLKWTPNETERQRAKREASVRRSSAHNSLMMGTGQLATTKRLRSKCRACNVWLHFADDFTEGSSCWELWHDTADLNTLRV